MRKPYLTIIAKSIYRARRDANICRLERNRNTKYHNQLFTELNYEHSKIPVCIVGMSNNLNHLENSNQKVRSSLSEEDVFAYIKDCLTESFLSFDITLEKINGTPGIYYSFQKRKKFIEISDSLTKAGQVKTLLNLFMYSHPILSKESDARIDGLTRRIYESRSDLVKLAKNRLDKLKQSTSL